MERIAPRDDMLTMKRHPLSEARPEVRQARQQPPASAEPGWPDERTFPSAGRAMHLLVPFHLLFVVLVGGAFLLRRLLKCLSRSRRGATEVATDAAREPSATPPAHPPAESRHTDHP